MNPNAVVVMWFITLLTWGLLESSSPAWPVGVVLAGVYMVYGVFIAPRRS